MERENGHSTDVANLMQVASMSKQRRGMTF